MSDINVLGLLLVTKAASAHLGEGASIINISSGVTAITPPRTVIYPAPKARDIADIVAFVASDDAR